ncbi:DNA translocase FtsK 4TM domain-containing protein, partial [Brevundimonas diminuta]
MSAALALGHRVWSTVRIVWAAPFAVRFRGVLQAMLAALLLVALISWNPADPSWNAASSQAPTNWLGGAGAIFADLIMQSLGLAAWPAVLLLIAFGLAVAIGDALQHRLQPTPFKIFCAVAGVLLLSAALSAPAAPAKWPLAAGMGGLWGDAVTGLTANGLGALKVPGARIILGLLFVILALWSLAYTVGLRLRDFTDTAGWAAQKGAEARAARPAKTAKPGKAPRAAAEPAAPARKPRHRLPEAEEIEADGPLAAPMQPQAAFAPAADAS